MKIISDLIYKVKEAFKSKEYRHAYVDEFLNVSIATQIKVLREQRGREWSQKDLADKVGMKQPRISVMENVNYSSWSINTLRKLAKAFDLTLRVSFESFGERIKEIDQFNREALERASFEEDPYFKPEPIDIPVRVGMLLGASFSLESPEVSKEVEDKTMGRLFYFDVKQKTSKNKMDAYQEEKAMPRYERLLETNQKQAGATQ
ncbi:MAG: helix-turn-helix transcriptional regulator [Desulfobaccales bacterium]